MPLFSQSALIFGLWFGCDLSFESLFGSFSIFKQQCVMLCSLVMAFLVFFLNFQELQDRIAKARDSNEDLTEVGRNLVNFHGEMVLLEIYSILNYTGTSLCSLL